MRNDKLINNMVLLIIAGGVIVTLAGIFVAREHPDLYMPVAYAYALILSFTLILWFGFHRRGLSTWILQGLLAAQAIVIVWLVPAGVVGGEVWFILSILTIGVLVWDRNKL